MTIDAIIKKAAVGLGLVMSLGCASEAGNPNSSYCSKDTDCKGDKICSKGVCVDTGSSTNSQNTTWTCESGFQMIANVCCKQANYELLHFPEAQCDKSTASGFYKSSSINSFQESCESKLLPTGNLNNYFDCVKQACLVNNPVENSHVNTCKYKYWL